MNTLFILMAQYDARAIVPLHLVCADYFTHLTPEKLKAKVAAGQIDLAIVPIEQSPKSACGVHVNDLANYLDIQRDKAKTEHDRLMGRQPKTPPRQSASKVEVRNDLPVEFSDLSIQFIRLPEVKRITGMCTSTIYKMVNDGLFPKQVKLGGRAVAWVRPEVLAWSKDKIEEAKKSNL